MGEADSLWQDMYSVRGQRFKSSAIRELLKVTEQPDFVSFAGGFPAPELFPVKEVAEVTQKILAEQGQQALQYSATEGYRPLRASLIIDQFQPEFERIVQALKTRPVSEGIELA